MLQRRTFIQSISAFFSSFGLFGKTPAQVAPAQSLGSPTGWTITWNDLESDKSLGYWLALPQSADRGIAFRVLVARPAGLARRINERELPNDASAWIAEAVVKEGRGRRVFADEVDWNDPETVGFRPEPTHYVIWDEEFIPHTPEAIEAAKQARRGRLIEMIQESHNGHHPLPGRGCSVYENGERIRIKPEGYIETAAPTPEEQALADKQRSFSENPPAFWELMHTTYGALWHGGDYPTTITCGYLAYKTLGAQGKAGGFDLNGRFCASDLLMSRSMNLRQVKFENSNFPGDPKYNRVIEMPDEAYL